MGIYNEYYKRYYVDLKKGNRSPQYRPESGKINYGKQQRDKFTLNIFSRSFVTNFTVQASVAIVLILGIVAAKLYPDSVVSEVYAKGKYYMEKGVISAEVFKSEQIAETFNQIKDFVAVDDKKEAFIMKNYKVPVDLLSVTDIKYTEGKVTMTLKNDSYIRAAYGGVVKEIKEGETSEVLVNHGNGVEIMYIGMDNFQVAKGSKVNSGDILGAVSGKNGNEITIEVFYMGSRLRPEKCFQLAVK